MRNRKERQKQKKGKEWEKREKGSEKENVKWESHTLGEERDMVGVTEIVFCEIKKKNQ
jgi:hypothetical protein